MLEANRFNPRRWPQRALLLAVPLLVGCQMASHGLNSEGVRLHAQGDYQNASKRFLQAVANDPNNADGYYNLAATYHSLGKVTGRQADLLQAENFYNQCLDRDPDHTDCYRGLAVLLAETNRSDASFRLLDGWIARNPTSADAKVELARLRDEFGNQEAAKQLLLAALNTDPNNARALTALGKIREDQGEHLQAIANYERSLQLNQMQPQVATRVAAMHSALGTLWNSPTGDTRVVQEPSTLTRY